MTLCVLVFNFRAYGFSGHCMSMHSFSLPRNSRVKNHLVS